MRQQSRGSRHGAVAARPTPDTHSHERRCLFRPSVRLPACLHSFRLLNYRTPMQFGFFRHGLMQPTLAARSAPVTPANPNEPLQRHLALTGNHT